MGQNQSPGPAEDILKAAEQKSVVIYGPNWGGEQIQGPNIHLKKYTLIKNKSCSMTVGNHLLQFQGGLYNGKSKTGRKKNNLA